MTENNSNDAVKTKALVAIRCITYNHEAYIRDALEGFIMQKTNFPFVAIVHDDASTDGTANIIREYAAKYPDIIKPIYETENQYSKHDGSLGRIMTAACESYGAKYYALCEGDDYWTDPLKLQKQVDFLEKHSGYGLVYTLAKSYIEKEKRFKSDILGGDYDNIDDMYLTNKIVTLTTCFRSDLYKLYLAECNTYPTGNLGDYPLWLFMASNSKIHCIKEVTGTYRVLDVSASHFIDLHKELSFKLDAFIISRTFAKKNGKEYMLPILKRRDFHSL